MPRFLQKNWYVCGTNYQNNCAIYVNSGLPFEAGGSVVVDSFFIIHHIVCGCSVFGPFLVSPSS